MTSRAKQYRQRARDFYFMARSLPHDQSRSTLMAEECDLLADQESSPLDHKRVQEIIGGSRMQVVTLVHPTMAAFVRSWRRT
jgi:hypothetical protein